MRQQPQNTILCRTHSSSRYIASYVRRIHTHTHSNCWLALTFIIFCHLSHHRIITHMYIESTSRMLRSQNILHLFRPRLVTTICNQDGWKITIFLLHFLSSLKIGNSVLEIQEDGTIIVNKISYP